ncbi:hypothetical protein RRG08_044935 [Elysia crispata]|uniref:Uncharacterized protein n=1 Tax=Elysia crispata TaxID=231223 RepID=A0AAE1DLR9_9GAST|nr:hypothetical protein RRG08_044935 [Elysia crispata]
MCSAQHSTHSATDSLRRLKIGMWQASTQSLTPCGVSRLECGRVSTILHTRMCSAQHSIHSATDSLRRLKIGMWQGEHHTTHPDVLCTAQHPLSH